MSPGQGANSHKKNVEGALCSTYLLGVKKAALVPFRMLSLKKSTAFLVPFGGVEAKTYDRRLC